MPQFHINQKLMNSIALLMTILTFCWFIKSLWLLVVEPDWCFNKAIHHSCTIWRHFAGICNVWCYSLLHTSREAIERNHSAAEGNNLSKSASQSLGFFLLLSFLLGRRESTFHCFLQILLCLFWTEISHESSLQNSGQRIWNLFVFMGHCVWNASSCKSS